MGGGRKTNAGVIAWKAAPSAALVSAVPTRMLQSVVNAWGPRMAIPPTQYPGTEEVEPWGLTGRGRHISLAADPWSLLSKPGAEQGLPHMLAAPVECLQLPICRGRRPGAGGYRGPCCACRALGARGVLGQGSASAHLPAAWRMGRLHTLSCQPSSKLPSWYRHRTPAPAGLGDAVRSIFTDVSAGPEMVCGDHGCPQSRRGSPAIPPPRSWPCRHALGTSAAAVAGIQLCLGPGAGAWRQLAVPGGRRWLCVQPCQAPQPVVHPGATVQSVYPQPAHIWGSNRRTAQLSQGLALC